MTTNCDRRTVHKIAAMINKSVFSERCVAAIVKIYWCQNCYSFRDFCAEDPFQTLRLLSRLRA